MIDPEVLEVLCLVQNILEIIKAEAESQQADLDLIKTKACDGIDSIEEIKGEQPLALSAMVSNLRTSGLENPQITSIICAHINASQTVQHNHTPK